MLLVDAYDVIIWPSLCDGRTVRDALRRANAAVLFGAERSCWPDDATALAYPPRGVPAPAIGKLEPADAAAQERLLIEARGDDTRDDTR